MKSDNKGITVLRLLILLALKAFFFFPVDEISNKISNCLISTKF